MNGITYNRICCMLPTFGRSATHLPQFLDSFIVMSSSPQAVCFCFCVNVNDEDTRNFLANYNWRGYEWEIIPEDLPKPNLAIYFNLMFNSTKTAKQPGTVVSMLGDDMVCRTRRWDQRILKLINAYNGVGVFWCNDDYIAKERCPVNLFVTRQFVDATEHPFMCVDFPGDMIDMVWGYVGHYTKTSHYDPDTHIFHNHNSHKPEAQWDSTFKRLVPSQREGHRLGKPYAREVAIKIANVLKLKGLTGNSIC